MGRNLTTNNVGLLPKAFVIPEPLFLNLSKGQINPFANNIMKTGERRSSLLVRGKSVSPTHSSIEHSPTTPREIHSPRVLPSVLTTPSELAPLQNMGVLFPLENASIRLGNVVLGMTNEPKISKIRDVLADDDQDMEPLTSKSMLHSTSESVETALKKLTEMNQRRKLRATLPSNMGVFKIIVTGDSGIGKVSRFFWIGIVDSIFIDFVY